VASHLVAEFGHQRPVANFDTMETTLVPRKPSQPETESDREMQQVMLPFVNACRKEIMQKWPHLEPDLALLRFLCQRQSIKPPVVSMMRKPRPQPVSMRKQQNEAAPPLPLPAAGAAPSTILGPESQRTGCQSPDLDHQTRPAEFDSNSRPASNLSFYKESGPSSRTEPRPDSVASTRFADTPLDETVRCIATPTDDVVALVAGTRRYEEKDAHDILKNDLDGLEFYDAAYVRDQNRQKATEKYPHGHFIEYELPATPIDACADTPCIVRHSACLRDRIDARRQETFAALGKTALKSLSKVLAQSENDFLKTPLYAADTTAGFADKLRGEFISKVPLLSLDVITQEEQYSLVNKLEPVFYGWGDPVFVEGDTGTKLYIVERGTCIVTKEVKGVKKTLCDIKPGDSFGDMAVMYDMARSATVSAATSVKLLSLSRDDIFSIVSPESLEKMRTMTRMQLLQSVPVLADLSREHKLLLLKKVRTDVFHAGREIMREGWRSCAMNRRIYIIEHGFGSYERVSKPAGHEVLVPGSNFGNVEFAFGCPSQSTVIADSEMSVFSIGYNEIDEALGKEADFALRGMQRCMRLKLLREAHAKFRLQDAQTLGSLLDRGTFHHFKAWQPIIKKGQPVKHLLMLDHGSCMEHDGDMNMLLDNFQEDESKLTEHSRPGETFKTNRSIDQKGAVAPCTLVAIGECSVFFLPAEALANLPVPPSAAVVDFDSD